MSALRTGLFRLIGVALLVVLAGGVAYYTVLVPRQRQQQYHAAPNPTPTASDATATSVEPPPSAIARSTVTATSTGTGGEGDGVVYNLVIKAGGCYETHPPASGGADVTPEVRSCDGPHNTVAISTHTLPEAPGVPFTGTDVRGEAQSLCTAGQEALIAGRPGFLELTIYPGADLWATGDRTVDCLVRDENGDVSGSFTG